MQFVDCTSKLVSFCWVPYIISALYLLLIVNLGLCVQNATGAVLTGQGLVQRIGKRMCQWSELLRRIWKDDWHLLTASEVAEALDRADINKTVESSLKDLYPEHLGTFWLSFPLPLPLPPRTYWQELCDTEGDRETEFTKTSRRLLMASGFLALIRSSEHTQGSWASRGVRHSSDLRLGLNVAAFRFKKNNSSEK